MKKLTSLFSLLKSKIKHPKAFILALSCLFLLLTTLVVVQQQREKQMNKSDAQTLAMVKTPDAPQRFVDNPKRGLKWSGLKVGKKNGPCKELLEIVNKKGKILGCTHGPDPAPDGVDATKSVEPLTNNEQEKTTKAASTVTCDGDGISGYRVQALYVRASDRPDRYAEFATSFVQYAQIVDSMFSESATQTGGIRHVRFVTDASCNLMISRVTLSPTGDDSYDSMATELKSLGYNRNDRKYLIWADSTAYCGIASVYPDDKADQTNDNNGAGPMYARTDSGCWGGSAEAHELMHIMGAVMLSAPNTSGHWHCTDEYDRMCYPDAAGVTMTTKCSSTADENHFDCNKDDYFNTNPPAGSYLETHWNTANSRFLINGGQAPTPTPTIKPTSTPTPTPTPPIITKNFPAIADTYVDSSYPSKIHGTYTYFFINTSPKQIAYLKFDLRSLAGKKISSIVLRVRTAKYGNAYKQNIRPVSSTSWSESTMKYSNRPAIGSVIGTLTTSSNDYNWVTSTNLTTALKSKAGYIMSIAIDQTTTTNRGVNFSSRESSYDPYLIIKYQ